MGEEGRWILKKIRPTHLFYFSTRERTAKAGIRISQAQSGKRLSATGLPDVSTETRKSSCQ